MRSDASHPASQIDVLASLRVFSHAAGRSALVGGYVVHVTEWAHIDILQLAFQTKHLRTLCESSADAIGELGQEVTLALTQRLADLSSAVSIKDILLGQPQSFDNGDLIIELVAGYRLLCRAGHPSNPRTASGVIEWEKVSRIRVVGIANS